MGRNPSNLCFLASANIQQSISIQDLLAPAKNLERLKVAVTYGADAVYVGGQKYGLRTRADNFSDSDRLIVCNDNFWLLRLIHYFKLDTPLRLWH